MIKTKNISEMLTSLIEEYRFNKNTLSKYLEITEETVDGVVMGKCGMICQMILHCVEKYSAKQDFCISERLKIRIGELSGFLEVACFLLWHIQANDSKNGWC